MPNQAPVKVFSADNLKHIRGLVVKTGIRTGQSDAQKS